MVFPGSEPIHLDVEKLFLLAVFKEYLDFTRGLAELHKQLVFGLLGDGCVRARALRRFVQSGIAHCCRAAGVRPAPVVSLVARPDS